jgi:hypothetical protein
MKGMKGLKGLRGRGLTTDVTDGGEEKKGPHSPVMAGQRVRGEGGGGGGREKIWGWIWCDLVRRGLKVID